MPTTPRSVRKSGARMSSGAASVGVSASPAAPVSVAGPNGDVAQNSAQAELMAPPATPPKASGRRQSGAGAPPRPNLPSEGTPAAASSSSGPPKPIFKEEPTSFSTKKERRTPRLRPPPRPPAKTAPPVSRIFKRRPDFLAPHDPRALTFTQSPDGSFLKGTPVQSISKVYDGSKAASFFEQGFSVEGEVGAGYFGTVLKARARDDGRLYAVKIAKERYRGSADRARKLEEVRKHQFLLPHRNCVHFYQSWEENGRLYQQFELCEGSLDDLAEKRHELPEGLVWSYLVDLLLALQHLHDHNLIHMDVKPENIFVGRDGICKLGDFGLVVDLAKDDPSGAPAGDSKYMAPELLEQNHCSKAADVFSLGLTILELACDLELPGGGHLWHSLRQTGPDPALTARLSPDLRRVIQLMMGRDPHRRPTVGQLLELPAVKKAHRKRTTELFVKDAFHGLKNFFIPAFLFILGILTFLLKPLLDKARSSFRRLGVRLGWDGFVNSGASASSGAEDSKTPQHTPENTPLCEPGASGRIPTGGTSFSSDEEDVANSSNSSLLAHPLPASPAVASTSAATANNNSSKAKNVGGVRHVSFARDLNEEGGLLPSPIRASGHYPRGPRRLMDRNVAQSTPSGLLRHRGRVAAAAERRAPTTKSGIAAADNGVSPNKKLNFDLGPPPLPEVDGPQQDGVDSDSDSDPPTPKIKPIALASRFDCYSDDNSDLD